MVAQSKWTIGAGHQSGFIIPHAREIESISDSNPWSIYLDLGKTRINEQSWAYCKCYPKLGLAARYVNFDQPDTLGHGFNLNFYVEPQFNPASKVFFSFRPEIGIVYLNRPFDPVENPLNQFYSSAISFWISLTAAVNFNVTDRSIVSLTADYSHISNGGMKDPNKGINFPMLGLKYQYALKATEYPVFSGVQELATPDPYWQVSIAGSSQNAGSDTRHPLIGMHVIYAKPLNSKSLFTLGTEYISDFSLQEDRAHTADGEPIHRAALMLGHNLIIGRFNFQIELGTYFLSPIKAKDPVYQRFSLGYQLSDRFVAGVSLKAHRHVADYADFRLGYKIFTKS